MTCYRFDVVSRRVSHEAIADAATAAHAGLTTDRLFIKDGTAVKPIGDGIGATGVWRSKVFSFGWPEGFGWAQVNGPLETGVVLRLYLDGTLAYTTPTITTSKPVRLPAKKGYHVMLEIESTDRVTGLAVAQAPTDLL